MQASRRRPASRSRHGSPGARAAPAGSHRPLVDNVRLGEAALDVADMAVQFVATMLRLRVGDARLEAGLSCSTRRARTHRLFGVEHGGQAARNHLDQAAGRLGRRFAFGDHGRDPLADETHDRRAPGVVGIVGVDVRAARSRTAAAARPDGSAPRATPGTAPAPSRVDARRSGRGDAASAGFSCAAAAVDRDIHRIAGAAGDHRRAGGSRRGCARTAWPARPASTWRIPPIASAIAAIAGAAAEVALQSARQIAQLRLVERGGGHDHARGAEAALEALRVEEGLLHRVEGRRRQAPRSLSLCAPRRGTAGTRQLCTGLPSRMHRAGAAVAGVATLLHAEPAEFAQERAKALAGPAASLRKLLPLTEKLMGAPPPARRGSPRRIRTSCGGASRAPWMSS